jgi:hypothetical protein
MPGKTLDDVKRAAAEMDERPAEPPPIDERELHHRRPRRRHRAGRRPEREEAGPLSGDVL